MKSKLEIKAGETIIPIESLKTIGLGSNDTLIVELPTRVNVSRETLDKIRNGISKITGGKTLILDCGLTAKAVIKSVTP